MLKGLRLMAMLPNLLVDPHILKIIKKCPMAMSQGYVKITIDKKTWLLHQWLLKSRKVIHRDGNTLDNRFINLTRVKELPDTKNTVYHDGKKLWMAYADIPPKRYVLGYYKTRELAIQAYQLFEKEKEK